MASGETSALKRFLLWDYARATWQYDVMVALILAFVFLTPREMFRDQPREVDIVRLPTDHGSNVFFVEPELLNSVAETERGARIQRELRSRFRQRDTVVRVEPILGGEQEVRGYMVYTHP